MLVFSPWRFHKKERILAQFAPDCRGNYTELGHELDKLFGIERLSAVRKGLVRTVVNFNQQSIRAGGNRRPAHGRDFVPPPRAM